MIEIPVIDRVLVVPDGFARRGPQRERRVVIEVLLVVAGQHEFRRRRRHRRPDIDEIELRVVAWNHPRADVPALFVRHVAPAVAAGLAGFRDRALAPELLARARVVARDDAGVGTAVRLAVTSRDQHTVRRRAAPNPASRDGSCSRGSWFPRPAPRFGVERVDEVVGAVVDDEPAVDREVAIRLRERHELAEIGGEGAAMLPKLLARRRVERRA